MKEIKVIRNVTPLFVARNMGLEEIKYKYVIWLDADMIMYDNILDYMMKKIATITGKYYSAVFYLKDTFLGMRLKGLRVLNGEVAVQFPFIDQIGLDRGATKRARIHGFKEYTFARVPVGTHFHEPEDEQVFKRFLMRGAKVHNLGTSGWDSPLKLGSRLKRLLNERGSMQYKIAIDAFEIGQKLRHKTGHSMVFGSKEWEKYIKG